MAATAGRLPPGAYNPLEKAPVPSELRPDGRPEEIPYLPQPEDDRPVLLPKEMDPIGPWASGRVDWSPLAGQTGIRPVVDKYSIARFSEGEWRKHNKEILDSSFREQEHACLVEWNARQSLDQIQANTNKNQEDNTKRLSQRTHDILRYKSELELAIAASVEEIELLETERSRLKRAGAVLMLPESIAGECLERRTARADSELVRDEVEVELIRELALTSEIRQHFDSTLKNIEGVLRELKTAKQRLEFDWSDKMQAHDLDGSATAFSNRSTIPVFHSGAARLPDEQSLPDFWENFTQENLSIAESTRQRSVHLRGTLDSILINAARDLRSQAEKVEMVLTKRIACTRDMSICLENELRKILQKLSDIEALMRHLTADIRKLDTPLKVAQSRLDIRLYRPRVENCRDPSQFGLIDEVKSLNESISELQAQFNQAELSRDELLKVRSELERDIKLKRQSLYVDKERLQNIRGHFPSAIALAGHGDDIV